MACGVSFTKGSVVTGRAFGPQSRSDFEKGEKRKGVWGRKGSACRAAPRASAGSLCSPKHNCLLEQFGFGAEGLCSRTLSMLPALTGSNLERVASM